MNKAIITNESKEQRELKGANEMAWEMGCELDVPHPNLQALVDKSIPMKVIPNKCVNVVANCPRCGENLEYRKKFHEDEGDVGYCPHCGQALDWSDE
jgi:predicted RNA-binding Zn-ribbon protein involved in translation (DUF1610 family)